MYSLAHPIARQRVIGCAISCKCYYRAPLARSWMQTRFLVEYVGRLERSTQASHTPYNQEEPQSSSLL